MNPTEKYFDNLKLPIITTVNNFLREGKSLFSSSSFQSQSIPLLHILSEIDGFKDVYMTNTGFLFSETIEFAYDVCSKFNLNLIIIKSELSKNKQIDRNGNFFYVSDPDYCCHVNKVLAMEVPLSKYDIWINGIRKDQSKERSKLSAFEKSKFNCLRYHPILDWTQKDIYFYNKLYNLPEHPLVSKGYSSIGCEPCTSCEGVSGNRNSRWTGLKKTECGLNTDLIYKE